MLGRMASGKEVLVFAAPVALEPPGWLKRARSLGRIARRRGNAFGLAVVLAAVLLAILGPAIIHRSPVAQDYGAILKPPGSAHPLGTDELGRDTLTRLIYGVRPSLQAGTISVALALLVGVPAGLSAGYFGRWLDEVLMRLADALWSFPGLVLALAVEAILGPGLINGMIAIGVVYAPVFARLVRSQTLSVREQEYVEAARASGAGNSRIMLMHIWPNVSPPALVQASLMVGQAILFEAALSFLGLGVQPPSPAWGSMLRTAYQYMFVDPWYAIFPGAAIFLTVLGFNLLGDGVREALDPRLRGAR
jgi:peptide/nickel transport system permease protein